MSLIRRKRHQSGQKFACDAREPDRSDHQKSQPFAATIDEIVALIGERSVHPIERLAQSVEAIDNADMFGACRIGVSARGASRKISVSHAFARLLPGGFRDDAQGSILENTRFPRAVYDNEIARALRSDGPAEQRKGRE